MNRLKDKVALITGGARGMGRATADLFVANGAKVVVADMRVSTAISENGIDFRHLDVSSEIGWSDLVEEVVQLHGTIDVLVNNAGIASYDPIDTLTMEEWQKVIAVNQTGVWLGMRAVVPILRTGGGGAIVNISSIRGITASAGSAAYHATKGAVRLMTKNAAIAFADDGIRANSVHPGFVETPMTEAQAPSVTDTVIRTTPLKRAAKPHEVANGVLFLASDEASYITGAELVIDGGFTTQ